MIVFNGAGGCLGHYLKAHAEKTGLAHFILRSRLHDLAGLNVELKSLEKQPWDAGENVTLIQLAALVPVGYCETHPQQAHQVNVIDTCRMVDCFIQWALALGIKTRIIYVSTGHIYKLKDVGVKTSEADPAGPRSVYARTKLEAENRLMDLISRQEVDFLVARVFGLVAPEQRSPYVLPGLIRRVRETNFTETMGLSNVRDYLDARDVVGHLAQMCSTDWRGINDSRVNICSGEPISIKDLLMMIGEQMGVTREALASRLPLEETHSSKGDWLVGDPSRLMKLTRGIAKQIPIQTTISEAVAAQVGCA